MMESHLFFFPNLPNTNISEALQWSLGDILGKNGEIAWGINWKDSLYIEMGPGPDVVWSAGAVCDEIFC